MLKSWRTLNARDPAGCAGLAGKIVHCSRVDGLVHHTRVECSLSRSRTVRAVTNRAFGGAEKGIKASLLRGGDHKLVQIELIGSVPAGKSRDRMNASIATSSSGVGSRKSGSVPPLFRASVRGKCWVTAPVANVRRSKKLPLSPNDANLWLRFRRWGDLRNTFGVGANPSMFSRIRPRPWGKFAVSALVLIRFGFSRPSTVEPEMAPRLPAVMLKTVPEHELLSLTVADKAGFMPP